VQKPTAAELEAAHHHAEHVAALEADLAHPVAGKEFDDHNLRNTDDVPLRGH
jgi:ubiquinol-cytochrome c reductase cytochrome b subunit